MAKIRPGPYEWYQVHVIVANIGWYVTIEYAAVDITVAAEADYKHLHQQCWSVQLENGSFLNIVSSAERLPSALRASSGQSSN